MGRTRSPLGALLAASVLFLAANPASGKAPGWIDWDRHDDRPKTVTIGQFALTTSLRRTTDATSTPVLTIRSEGRRPLTIVGATGLTAPFASVAVFPANGPPGQFVILFRSFTGGAHCCQDYRLIAPTAKGWRVRSIGHWDDGIGPEPQDADGDGRLELVGRDQRFDYRLTSHAESFMPPVVFDVRDGELVDISSEPRFRRLYWAELKAARKACESTESQMGSCLGYVAIAARAGAGAGAEALAVLDKKPEEAAGLGWTVPKHCGGSPVGCAHEKPEQRLPTRHEAVVHFLTDLGYMGRKVK